jgi:hypothetical protein
VAGIFSWLAGWLAFSADKLGGWHFQLVGWLAFSAGLLAGWHFQLIGEWLTFSADR